MAVTLILDNDEIARLLDVGEGIEALDAAYRALARGDAANRPRTDIYAPHECGDDTYYVFKSFEGMLPKAGVVALRVNSDVISWSDYSGSVRKDKVPLAPGGRWVGLIFLFSTRTGQLLAIMPDGFIQSARVAATTALAARAMARPDSEVYGILGTGQQAGAQLLAMAHIRRLRIVRVFSPNPVHRTEFVRHFSDVTGLDIRPVDSVEAAARGADILGVATNAVRPVLQSDCVTPGMHVTCVKLGELDDLILHRADRVIVHTHMVDPHNYFAGVPGRSESTGADPVIVRAGRATTSAARGNGTGGREPRFDMATTPVLSDLLTGGVLGRASDSELNVFINNMGAGIQFAALGGLVHDKARAAGVGRELPDDWFSELLHP